MTQLQPTSNKSVRTSIILLTFNNLVYTRLCLESICSKTSEADYEIIVVDNASEDYTPRYLTEFKKNHQNCITILNSENRGIASGFNAGAAKASGEFLVFLHNDTVVTQGWLDQLLNHLLDPFVGMVAPVTNDAKNKCHIQVGYKDLVNMEAFAQSYTNHPARKTIEVDRLSLFCAAIRRSVFSQIGPFDERFKIGGFEDEDYSMRLRQHGYKLLCTEKVYIHHWGRAGFNLLDFDLKWTSFQKNRARFENKWRVRWHPSRYRDEYLDEQLRNQVDKKIEFATEIIELKREIIRLNELLADTYKSKGWKFLKTLRRFQSWILPKNSGRAKIANLLWSPFGNLLGKGRTIKSDYQRDRRSILDANNLERIMGTDEQVQDIIIFAPTVSWGVPLFQRPHQLALAFARQNCLVFFCEPSYSNSFPSGFTKINDRLYVVSNISPDVLGQIPSPVVLTLAYNADNKANYSDPRTIYEFIDKLEVFRGDMAHLYKTHNEMLFSAYLVIATADELLCEIKQVRPDALLVPNGVDFDFIRSAIEVTSGPPTDMQPLVQGNKPLIGYYGALAEWFDYDLLFTAASKRPEYTFVLIGPDYDKSYEASSLKELNNIHWLGAKSYAELPRYLKYFDVATIPFILNEITHATSPIKLFEYMTAGKPIVTTAMHECTKYPVVLIGQDEQDYILKLDKALELSRDEAYQKSLQAIAKQNTWDQRAEMILSTLRSKNQKDKNSVH